MIRIIDRRQFWRGSQRGQIILTTVLLLGLIVTTGFFYSLGKIANFDINANAQTERALAQAKEVLIAYASGRDATNRPGELPCPDTNNDGNADFPCGTMVTPLGRFPWKTLGAPDLVDGSGERLWYAVSSNFKNNPAVTPLNSNSQGQLTVTGISPANNVVAILFAPGAVIASQSRTAANINNVAHYLEGDNATNGDARFISDIAKSTFNDKLLSITPAMFFPAVETRVAQQIRSTLNAYYTANKYFPPANDYDVSCLPANQGMIPANPMACGALFAGWSPPSWFTTEQWYRVMFYAVAPACVDTTAINCTGAGGFLTVNGVGGVRALIVSPGTKYPGQPLGPCTRITDCLEPPNTTSFPSFTQVTGSSTANDRVVIVAP